MKIRLLFAAFILIFFAACDSKSKNSGDSEMAEEELELMENVPQNIVAARTIADSLLQVNDIEGLYSTLTNGFWHYDAVIRGKPEPDSTAVGKWIKFEADFSYIAGKWDDQNESGKWAYDAKSDKLTIVNNKDHKMPAQWKVLHKGNTIICAGTAEFKNNDTQMKWSNSDSTPVKE